MNKFLIYTCILFSLSSCCDFCYVDVPILRQNFIWEEDNLPDIPIEFLKEPK